MMLPICAIRLAIELKHKLVRLYRPLIAHKALSSSFIPLHFLNTLLSCILQIYIIQMTVIKGIILKKKVSLAFIATK